MLLCNRTPKISGRQTISPTTRELHYSPRFRASFLSHPPYRWRKCPFFRRWNPDIKCFCIALSFSRTQPREIEPLLKIHSGDENTSCSAVHTPFSDDSPTETPTLGDFVLLILGNPASCDVGAPADLVRSEYRAFSGSGGKTMRLHSKDNIHESTRLTSTLRLL